MKTILTVCAAMALAAAPALAGSVSGTLDCKGGCEAMVVFLEGAAAQSGEGTSVIFDQKDKVFLPHVLPILRGTTVDITNGDPFLHNVHIYNEKDTVLNIALPFQGQVIQHTFEETGTYPVLCDAHPEMSAYIFVADSPYFAAVGDGGSYSIDGVPAGSYTLVARDLAGDRELSRSPVVVD